MKLPHYQSEAKCRLAFIMRLKATRKSPMFFASSVDPSSRHNGQGTSHVPHYGNEAYPRFHNEIQSNLEWPMALVCTVDPTSRHKEYGTSHVHENVSQSTQNGFVLPSVSCVNTTMDLGFVAIRTRLKFKCHRTFM